MGCVDEGGDDGIPFTQLTWQRPTSRRREQSPQRTPVRARANAREEILCLASADRAPGPRRPPSSNSHHIEGRPGGSACYTWRWDRWLDGQPGLDGRPSTLGVALLNLEVLSEPTQPAQGRDPNRSGALAENLGRLSDIQPRHGAEHDDLSLITWQRRDQAQRPRCAEPLMSQLGGVPDHRWTLGRSVIQIL